MRYMNARAFVAENATRGGLAFPVAAVIHHTMFSSRDFLARVLEKAGTKAAIGAALGLPSSRVAEFFREKGDRQRRLTMEEGVTLARAFGIPLDGKVSAEQLIPVLRIALRHASKETWTDLAIEQLAQESELGLSLLQDFPERNPDVLEVVSRAIAGLHPDKRA